ncbi:DNA helicase UvrD [Dokdonia sinensis]|uniref:DNA 3'-5' helicase n=1 Tax=Dokdonia sinensis TaxID=2479847 RepID=A0A3M0GDQ1_9FLAO|nr:UvrD-helicase domain-containing protein [Dokdonia sinensis]RMB63291.1 DNA helicase UvrD [Dokdonia sinensis]
MSQHNTFTIYNASAGSGKTYTLVKQYVSILLRSNSPYKYRNLLAITFTNKAVEEMKERVITTLLDFSNYNGDKEIPTMMEDLSNSLKLSQEEIIKKSKIILENIIHDYASLDILTIDTLTHRILRTFSKDLGLSGNFEISLDVNEIYEKAVDLLIDKAGTDKEITEVLINFALEKADDDKSWDISYDLNTIAKLLYKENDRDAITRISKHDLADFKKLKTILNKKILSLKTKIKTNTDTALELINNNGLTLDNFLSTFSKHLQKLDSEPETVSYPATTKWLQDISVYNFYRATEKSEIKATIDSIKPQLITFFDETKALHYKITELEDFKKRLVPLSVLRLIYNEIQSIKEDQNLLLISDFNEHIFKYLRNEPAAFIYERLGERYTNYFVDEFQDTSVMQWSNLIPLMESALSSQSEDEVPNTALLVGDPKQAIYRWRGGKAEQFIDLSNGKQPFAIENFKTEYLDTNWRSHEEIIKFNNAFFTHLAQEYSNPNYEEIYKTGNTQNTNHRKGGYVALNFVEGATVEELEPLYLKKTLQIVREIQQDNIPLNDICILTRSNKHGAAVARFLAENDIKVVSNESLLLSSSPEVNCLNAMLTLMVHPDTAEITIVVLEYLTEVLKIEDKHYFIAEHIHLPTQQLLQKLSSEYQILIETSIFNTLPLYEGAEYLLRALSLDKKGDAFLVGYLNEIYEFTAKNGGLSDFLAYYELKKDKLSIQIPRQEDAIQLMTIHKSKGLEFPVVIFPYADADLYSHREEYHWLETEAQTFGGFEELLISHRSEMVNYGELPAALYEERQSQQQFDAINVLYVALTRAVRRLYVVSRFRESKNKKMYYGHLLQSYIQSKDLWEGPEKRYDWGTTEVLINKESKIQTTQKIEFFSSPKEAHNIQVITKASTLWNEQRQEAISYGNLLHELLAKIKHRGQQEAVIEQALEEGLINREQVPEITSHLNKVMLHPDLQELFINGNTIYNERPILDSDGNIHIPDRIEINADGKLTIIDYKTGVPQESHEYQLDRYTAILKEMELETSERKLVYINQDVTVLTV